jgi:hypothetical protein
LCYLFWFESKLTLESLLIDGFEIKEKFLFFLALLSPFMAQAIAPIFLYQNIPFSGFPTRNPHPCPCFQMHTPPAALIQSRACTDVIELATAITAADRTINTDDILFVVFVFW